jgi:hypothetical protein
MAKSKARHMGDMMGADGIVKTTSAPEVATARLATGSVTTAKIADANVTTAKIADANVTTAKITDSNVTTAKIADANVTTAKITDSNVTTAKIADNAVNSDKVTPTLAVGVPTTVISSSATAVANNHYFIDTATQTLTLPASPTAGQKVLVTVGNFTDTTVARNGENIASLASDLIIDVANMGVTLCYTNTSRGWVVL